mmetsp:Transcript_3061/g.8086  ORF Transcript_3061/g.8086 Transcript_3061/m.8086 type:complete len:156 (+) Transcript_3061:59-526(+)|eukprot:CAMPEP_0202340366 /NCGR_PEP_ID=MMETSP1126-20121109/1835_1 /ASSEMBLY_ACC=CAM_ASM_000457 /TAXON_ID=3047 /ORGANISM="Dunaliella tertiolecta, Strain CCMP1320" /LENGTH=155 /DNA_ID=CAMNT_0048931059 /DNA_START=25 /DNA_END=492 /DNA_ORIENTATION=+
MPTGSGDDKLRDIDKAYLDKHKIGPMFETLLSNMVQHQPQDPLQYIIDSVEFNAEYAKQDPATGLPEHRKAKLLDVFRLIDKEGRGRISYQNLQSYATKYGGATLKDEELQSIFSDFHPGKDSQITMQEFLVFFSKASKAVPNAAFDSLIQELMT